GAQLQAARLGLGTRRPGDKDRRRVDALLNHDLEEPQTVERRDVHVQQQQIELAAAELHQSIGTVADADRVVSGFAEKSVDQRGGYGVIFDDEDQDRSVERLSQQVARCRRLLERDENLLVHALGLGTRCSLKLAPENVRALLISPQ